MQHSRAAVTVALAGRDLRCHCCLKRLEAGAQRLGQSQRPAKLAGGCHIDTVEGCYEAVERLLDSREHTFNISDYDLTNKRTFESIFVAVSLQTTQRSARPAKLGISSSTTPPANSFSKPATSRLASSPARNSEPLHAQRHHAARVTDAAGSMNAGATKLSTSQVMTGTVTASPKPNRAWDSVTGEMSKLSGTPCSRPHSRAVIQRTRWQPSPASTSA